MSKNQNLYENDKWLFIWGVKANDDAHFGDSNLFSLNDIEILFNKNDKKYYLGIETVYLFGDINDRIYYYQNLLKKFKEYMIENSQFLNTDNKSIQKDKNIEYPQFIADNINELYLTFEKYVKNQAFLN